MPDIRCFLLVPTTRVRRELCRYSAADKRDCPLRGGWCHNALAPLDVIDEPDRRKCVCGDLWPHDDPRWPVACQCGYAFTPADHWQLFCSTLYRRSDNGEETTLSDAPDGAMWYADWMTHNRDASDHRYFGPDGRCLVCRVPKRHDWMIDGPASNCTKPDDKAHKCWVRHGEPPLITVDKNGDTCNAGAGSILTPDWHGFLRNGVLTTG